MIPSKRKNGITFFPVPKFSAKDSAFGVDEGKFFNRHNLPYIPAEFEDMAQSLFFNGGKLPKLSRHVDAAKASTAIRAWLGSWSPSHESKIATVGYALWLWTNDEALSK